MLVFVHGGALTRGSAALPTYDGVTLRPPRDRLRDACSTGVGQEGFAVLEDVPHNLGVLDQQAALCDGCGARSARSAVTLAGSR